MEPVPLKAARKITLLFVVAATLAVILLMQATTVRFDYASVLYLMNVLVVFLAAGFYCHFRGMDRLGAGLEVVALGFFLTIPVLVSTYLSISLAMPLADDALARMDAALGFDWHAFLAFVDRNRPVADLLGYAYQSFSFQLLLLPILLVALGKAQRAYAFVFSYGLVCFASSFISIWYPALGTYVVYGVSPGDVSHINSHFAFAFLKDFNAVRGESEFVLALGHASGILTFPSVHAAMAALCAWAAWGSRLLRYPFALLNGAMAISAVSHANHYLVDVIAGAGVTAAVAALATWLFYRPAESTKAAAASSPLTTYA